MQYTLQALKEHKYQSRLLRPRKTGEARRIYLQVCRRLPLLFAVYSMDWCREARARLAVFANSKKPQTFEMSRAAQHDTTSICIIYENDGARLRTAVFTTRGED